MAGYNFYDIFQPMEFQTFARDMVQKRVGITFETFAGGPDQGIDGRCVLKDGSVIILQVKWGRITSGTILKIAKAEKVKLDMLAEQGVRICRYILVLSGDIGVKKKTQVMELFSPYIISPEDIITGADLNNDLSSGDVKYRAVEEKYPKLWIQNANVLRRTLHEVVHSPLLERSRINLEEAIEKAKFFVETDVYEEAIRKLKRSRTLIISGEPGVGKTTLANQAALYYYTKFKFQSFIYASSVDDLYIAESTDSKKVIVFDDFWGDTGFDALGNGKRTKDLISFIEHIQKRKDCILIITTREYILEQGLKKNEEFRRLVKNYKLDCRVEQYSNPDKLRIYYGHLKNASLTWSQVKRLSGAGSEIIKSPNYNPRVIETFVGMISPDMTPDDCVEQFFRYLNCPTDFWKKIFEELSQEAKVLYLLMAIMPLPVEWMILEKCYLEVLKAYDKFLEWKGFAEVIVELEKTVIRTDLYNQEFGVLYAITFQNPSVKDFIQDIIRENLEKYGPVLLQSCIYYTQCIEFLNLLKGMKNADIWYHEVMNKSIMLLDSASIIFYDRYKKILQHNKEMNHYFQTFRTEQTGTEQSFGRWLQLFMLYDREKCSMLKPWFEEHFFSFVQNVEQYPESVLSEDLEFFSDVAVQMIEMGICRDKEWLLDIYMDSLMQNRMELEGGAFERSCRHEWERYIEINKEKISAYLEKLYDAELCLAAVKKDEEEFSDWEIECEEAYHNFGLELPNTLLVKIEKYDQWFTQEIGNDSGDENDEEQNDEYPKRTKWTVNEIKQEFKDGYLEEILPTEVDDFAEWLRNHEIPVQIKDIMTAEELTWNQYWSSFMDKEESLEFIIGLIQWNENLPVDISVASCAVVRYIAEQCEAPNEVLENFLTQMALSGNEEGIFSQSELEQMFPGLILWDDKVMQEMEKIHVLVHRQKWYYLSNRIPALSFHIEHLRTLPPEKLGTYFYYLFLEEEEALESVSTKPEDLTELIETGKRWLKSFQQEREFISLLYQLKQDVFIRRVMVPLAKIMHDKLYANTEEEIVANLVELFEIENTFAMDGTWTGGSVSFETYFLIAEIIFDADFIKVFPDELTEEQMRILSDIADMGEGEWKISVIRLREKGLLRYFGIYDKMLTIWNDICKLIAEEISDGRENGAGDGRKK